MKPTMINAGLRTIRLEYNNEKLPNELEQKVLREYQKLHYDFEPLAKSFDEFEKKLSGHASSLQTAVSSFEALEKECLVIEYFFDKPGKNPPEGIKVPETMNSDFTNTVIKHAESLDLLMDPLYDWVDNIHPLYKKWISDLDAFDERLDKFQEDVSSMFSKWEEGTVDISQFDDDLQHFYKFTDDLQKRYIKFSREYNKVVLRYNDIITRITHAYDQLNSVSDKTQKILKEQPWHRDNINLN